MSYPAYLTQKVIKYVEQSGKSVNWYYCPACKHTAKAVLVDKGVTPMFLTCGKCGETSQSTIFSPPFPEAATDLMKPEVEWYRPTDEEFNKMPEGHKEHYRQGGLHYRRLTQ